jgi:hypothetical protein
VFAGTDDGMRLLKDIKNQSMNEIRALIDALIEKKYDTMKPIAASDQHILKSRDVCSELIIHVHLEQSRMNEVFSSIHENLGTVHDVIDYMNASLIPHLVSIPIKANRSGSELQYNLNSLVLTFKGAYGLLKEASDHSLMIDDTENQNFAIDSDEEERLYRELDLLMESQERAEAFTGNAHKFMANSVQKTVRIIDDLQNCFQLVYYSA